MSAPVGRGHLPSGTAADAWVVYLLTARRALGGGEPDGPWRAWRDLHRRHHLRASILWWWQILMVTGAWALGSVFSAVTFVILVVVGWASFAAIAVLPGTMVVLGGGCVALFPVISPRRLARHLGLVLPGRRGPG